MAMKREVANTIGSENIRNGRTRASDRVFVMLCFLATRGAGLADVPTQVLSARARRACKIGPYVSVRLSGTRWLRWGKLYVPGRNSKGMKDTPANISATQYFRLQLTGETKPAMMGPLAGPIFRTLYQVTYGVMKIRQKTHYHKHHDS